jgi:predicted nucleotidyltransferase
MATGTLHRLFSGGTLRLLTHFLVHPDRKLHFRALKEHTRLGTGSLQRELARLESLGLVTREEREGKVCFASVTDHPSWDALRTLVREHGDPVDVLRETLSDLEGVKAAFVFGSTVRGDARPDSDIDVFILEEGLPLEAIGRATLDAQRLLDRPLDVRRYTPTVLARKLRDAGGFLHDVLSGPKAWLVGSEEALSALRLA